MTCAVEFDLHSYSRPVRRYHTRRSDDGGASGAAIHTASGARLLFAIDGWSRQEKVIEGASKVILREML